MRRRENSLADWRALDAQLGPDCLRIACYNVHGCVGGDNRRDDVRIARVIEELGCDTIGLQEVHGLDTIASETGMQAISGPPYVWHGRHVGNALLTRRPVLAVRQHEYTFAGCEPRCALDVDLEVCGGPVRVIVTHLGLKPIERRFQVRRLLQLIRKTPLHERVVVLGDLNEWLPLSRPLRWMNSLLGRSPAERSFPARFPLFALDRVWVRPRHALLALGAHRSELSQKASDHLPVKAIVATRERAAGLILDAGEEHASQRYHEPLAGPAEASGEGRPHRPGVPGRGVSDRCRPRVPRRSASAR